MAGRCARTSTSRATTTDAWRPGDRAIDTTWLTHARFQPTAPNEQRRRLHLAVGALLLALVVSVSHGFLGDLFIKARDLAALRRERESLTASVERLQTELAVERAKRRELERHAIDLNAQVAELNGQVEFLRARKTIAKSAD